MLQPKYTMYGLEVKDVMSQNGSLHTRVLRVVLTSHLAVLQSSMLEKVRAVMMDEISTSETASDGWTSIRSFCMAKNLIRTANSGVFFGESLSREKRFLTAALQYPDDLLIASEMLRFVPTVVAPLAAPIFMRNRRGSRVMAEYLVPMIQRRLEARACAESSDPKPLDCVQWIIDSNPKKEPWPPEKIVQAVLGLWFASVHQPAIQLVYTIEALCKHTEYLEPLREEIRQHMGNGESALAFDHMPLLDSFLKESARMYPSDSISVRRKALSTFTFSDGSEVKKGEVACLPLRAMMRDPENYHEATAFDGFRFVNGDGTKNTSKFAEGDRKYPLWGLGRRIWYSSLSGHSFPGTDLTGSHSPGRYYSVHVIKVVVAHMILQYDIKMGDCSTDTTRTFHWRSATIPKSTSTLSFRKR